jgi:hypothetical protein
MKAPQHKESSWKRRYFILERDHEEQNKILRKEESPCKHSSHSSRKEESPNRESSYSYSNYRLDSFKRNITYN